METNSLYSYKTSHFRFSDILKCKNYPLKGIFNCKEMDINELVDNLIDRFWKWRLRDVPEFGTFIGVHDYDDRLMDLSLGGYLRRRDDAKAWLEETRELLELSKIKELRSEAKVHLDYLEDDMETFLNGLRFQTYLCPLNQIDGPHRRLPILLAQMKKDSEKDFRNILTRLRLFPNQIEQMVMLMSEGIRLGKTAFIKTVESYPEILLGVSKEDVSQSKLFAPFKEKPSGVTSEVWNEILGEAKDVIGNCALPAFKRLGVFIRDVYIPKTRPELGITTMPSGVELYETLVCFHTDRGVTPKQMYDFGKKRLTELHKKLGEQKEVVCFDGTMKEFMEDLRYNGQFHFSSREEMLECYPLVCKSIESKLPKIFKTLPKMPYEVKPAPAEIEKEYCSGAYVAGLTETNRPGYFVLNTYMPWQRKRMDMQGLILHELLPGHHIQLALTAESGQKGYRRFADELRLWDHPAHIGMKSAYHEGWATYAEYLGHELGLYDDPYHYIGSLSRDMQLACRLVVDVGLHMYGWSEKEAFDFLVENTIQSEIEIQTEIKRHISMPAQSMSYLYGAERMKDFRKKAEQELGGKFDIKSYHNMIALLGDVPMFIVENAVDQYIAEQKK